MCKALPALQKGECSRPANNERIIFADLENLSWIGKVVAKEIQDNELRKLPFGSIAISHSNPKTLGERER